MDSAFVRLLLIEDQQVYARLVREHLTNTDGVQVELEHVDRLSAGLARLAPTFRASRRHFVPKFRGKHPISSQSDFRL